MEQKTFQVINTINCHYVYDKSAKKLMSMRPVDVTFNLETGEVQQTFCLGGESEKVGVDINNDFYASEGSFREGNQVFADRAITNMTITEILKMLYRNCYVKSDEIGAFVWVYENEEATKWRLEEHTKTVHLDYNDNDGNSIDCQLPEAYEDVEEVYMYNDYTVQGEDGKPEVREGVYKRLKLTDEQNALLDKLEDFISECNKANIAIEYDLGTYQLVAFNTANIKTYGYDPVVDVEKEEAYNLDLSRCGRRIGGVDDINTQDDCNFIIEVK